MAEQPPEGLNLHALGEIIAISAVTAQRHRDFLARKVARVFMEEIGLILQDDDVGNAALEELLGTGIATGMILSADGATTPRRYRQADKPTPGGNTSSSP